MSVMKLNWKWFPIVGTIYGKIFVSLMGNKREHASNKVNIPKEVKEQCKIISKELILSWVDLDNFNG